MGGTDRALDWRDELLPGVGLGEGRQIVKLGCACTLTAHRKDRPRLALDCPEAAAPGRHCAERSGVN
jgi:hypothetical protein